MDATPNLFASGSDDSFVKVWMTVWGKCGKCGTRARPAAARFSRALADAFFVLTLLHLPLRHSSVTGGGWGQSEGASTFPPNPPSFPWVVFPPFSSNGADTIFHAACPFQIWDWQPVGAGRGCTFLVAPALLPLPF